MQHKFKTKHKANPGHHSVTVVCAPARDPVHYWQTMRKAGTNKD